MKSIYYPTEYCVYDLETTGVDPMTCEITEIAVKKVSFDRNKATGEISNVVEELHSFLLKTKNPIPDDAARITGITNEMVQRDGYEPKEVLLDLYSGYFNNNVIVGHNIFRYDNVILNRYLKELNVPIVHDLIETLCIDTGALFKAHALKGTLFDGDAQQKWYENHREYAMRIMDIRAAGVRWNLGEACRTMGIDCSDLTAHRAAADVEMVDRLYRHMTTPVFMGVDMASPEGSKSVVTGL